MDLTIITKRDKLIELCNSGKYESPAIETSHEFVDGMYIRTMFAPKGSLLVGATHKKDSYEILLSGTILVNKDDSVAEITAPFTLKTKEGSGKNGYCVTDVVYMNVYRTDKTDIEDVEKELFVEKIYKNKELG